VTLWHPYRPCDCSVPCDVGCHEPYSIDTVCGEPPENHIKAESRKEQ
jgi:hypothetical protein